MKRFIVLMIIFVTAGCQFPVGPPPQSFTHPIAQNSAVLVNPANGQVVQSLEMCDQAPPLQLRITLRNFNTEWAILGAGPVALNSYIAVTQGYKNHMGIPYGPTGYQKQRFWSYGAMDFTLASPSGNSGTIVFLLMEVFVDPANPSAGYVGVGNPLTIQTQSIALGEAPSGCSFHNVN